MDTFSKELTVMANTIVETPGVQNKENGQEQS